MFGLIITTLSVFGGYAMAGGHLLALFQPLELLMIAGAATGSFIAANNLKIIKSTISQIFSVIISFGYSKKFYVELLSLLFEIVNKMKKDGIISIENELENLDESTIFNKYPLVKKDKEIMEFLSDYLRIIITGRVDMHQLESLMDEDIESFIGEKEQSIHAITQVADSMPAFGVVAAVMGIVHTMEAMGGPPEELGALIGQALVGTFLGVLIGYAFTAPFASIIEHKLHAAVKGLNTIKIVLLASVNNLSPAIAVEFGRKVLYAKERPNSRELEELIKTLKQNKPAT